MALATTPTGTLKLTRLRADEKFGCIGTFVHTSTIRRWGDSPHKRPLGANACSRCLPRSRIATRLAEQVAHPRRKPGANEVDHFPRPSRTGLGVRSIARFPVVRTGAPLSLVPTRPVQVRPLDRCPAILSESALGIGGATHPGSSPGVRIRPYSWTLRNVWLRSVIAWE